MRKTLLLLGLTVAFLFGTAYGQPGIDSVYLTAESADNPLGVVGGNTINMHPLGGGDVVIRVNTFNGLPISALGYPFVETIGTAQMDSLKNNDGSPPLCMVGGRGDLAPGWTTTFNHTQWLLTRQFLLGGIAMGPSMAPGNGYYAKMIFTFPAGQAATQICLDTMTHPPGVKLEHVDDASPPQGFMPNWTSRCFNIVPRPNTSPVGTCPATISGFTVLPVNYSVSAIDAENDAINAALGIAMVPNCGTFTVTNTGPDSTCWLYPFEPI